MKNERKTENIVRDRLRELGYYDPTREILVEEQQSDFPRIKKLLKLASKKGQGIGYPEFIITSAKHPELLIVVECKADIKKHISGTIDQYGEYAVDGALLYASYLSKDYDVIAIGVSGQTKQDIRISHYICLKGSMNQRNFVADKLLSFSDYFSSYIADPTKFNQEYTKLLGYSKDLNEILHVKKIKESQRSLLISGILIALKNQAFIASFKKYRNAQQLANSLVSTVIDEIKGSDLPQNKIESLRQAFSFIQTHSTLSKDMVFF